MAGDDFCRGSFRHLHASARRLVASRSFSPRTVGSGTSKPITCIGCVRWASLRLAVSTSFPGWSQASRCFFPMQWAPLIMNFAGAVIQALPVSALLSRRCSPWGPLPVRMLMAALYIAIPDAPEIHVVLTNAVWHLALLQALLAFSLPPLSWRGRVSDILLFGIGGTHRPLLYPSTACGRRLLVVSPSALDACRSRPDVCRRSYPGAEYPAHGKTSWSASRADPTSSFADHRRQHLYRQYGRHRRPEPADSVPRRRRHRRIVNSGLGLAQRTACGTPLYRLRNHRSDGCPERSSPAAEQHSLVGRCSRMPWESAIGFCHR